jgi:hypothetical protein
MAINFTTVKLNLYQWMITVVPSGMPVIFWEPNAPNPSAPYVTMYLNSIVSVNQDWTAADADASGVVDMKGDRQFTLQVNAYGGDPLTVLENIRTSLQKQTVLDTLRANGIAFYQAVNIADITELVDSQWERRGSLDILFGIGQIYTDAPGYFDELELQQIYEDATGSIVYDETITITSP